MLFFHSFLTWLGGTAPLCPRAGTEAWNFWQGPFPANLSELQPKAVRRSSYHTSLHVLQECFGQANGSILLSDASYIPEGSYCGRVQGPSCWNRGHQWARSWVPSPSHKDSAQNLLPEAMRTGSSSGFDPCFHARRAYTLLLLWQGQANIWALHNCTLGAAGPFIVSVLPYCEHYAVEHGTSGRPIAAVART